MSNALRTQYDAIYLSPHLDDAALSCGGQIFQRTRRGEAILVVSVMAGDPSEVVVSDYAQSLHTRWALLASAADARRAEDLAACRVLGADALHWDVADCIYRTDPQSGLPFYTSDDDIFGAIAVAETTLVAELARRLSALPPSKILFAPLGIGHHVDHQLTRAAAERSHAPESLRYYADYPYAQDEAALGEALKTINTPLQLEVIPLDPQALNAKIRAISAYASQVSTFWASHDELVEQVTHFAMNCGGEMLWRP
ncbi:MAG: PIG-L family deacetylase [Caldilineaceae bacterium]|nr:PIG-L family deacetylase [Caldilineaceae bacterium]